MIGVVVVRPRRLLFVVCVCLCCMLSCFIFAVLFLLFVRVLALLISSSHPWDYVGDALTKELASFPWWRHPLSLHAHCRAQRIWVVRQVMGRERL